MVGCLNTRLVVLRGNSGSGKSTIAEALRARLGRGVAWIEQDYFRRTILGEHDQPGLPNIGLIDANIRYALDAGYHVIAEGILGSARYGDMLRRLTEDHRGVTRHYYFDIPLTETQRRYRSKPFTVAAEKLAGWYQEGDLLRLSNEAVITANESQDQIIERLIREIGFTEPPVRSRLRPQAHLG